LVREERRMDEWMNGWVGGWMDGGRYGTDELFFSGR